MITHARELGRSPDTTQDDITTLRQQNKAIATASNEQVKIVEAIDDNAIRGAFERHPRTPAKALAAITRLIEGVPDNQLWRKERIETEAELMASKKGATYCSGYIAAMAGVGGGETKVASKRDRLSAKVDADQAGNAQIPTAMSKEKVRKLELEPR
jgi:hypothetical protein